MLNPKTVTVQTEVPAQRVNEAEMLIQADWYRSLDEVFFDALRRFVESHRGELMEQFIREDVEWGFRGEQ